MWPWKKEPKPKVRTEIGKHSFYKAVQFTLKWEGGYVNDSKDPGGETSFGISKRAYPSLDIAELTQAEAIKIYYKDYWLKAGCDKLPTPENIALFDFAVNVGVTRALKLVATADTWQDILLIRVEYYVKLARQEWAQRYLRGWLNRVMELKTVFKEIK